MSPHTLGIVVYVAALRLTLGAAGGIRAVLRDAPGPARAGVATGLLIDVALIACLVAAAHYLTGVPGG